MVGSPSHGRRWRWRRRRRAACPHARTRRQGRVRKRPRRRRRRSGASAGFRGKHVDLLIQQAFKRRGCRAMAPLQRGKAGHDEGKDDGGRCARQVGAAQEPHGNASDTAVPQHARVEKRHVVVQDVSKDVGLQHGERASERVKHFNFLRVHVRGVKAGDVAHAAAGCGGGPRCTPGRAVRTVSEAAVAKGRETLQPPVKDARNEANLVVLHRNLASPPRSGRGGR